MLSLSDIKSGWKELASWNAAPRGYAVSAAQNNGADDCFYLFSGRNYAPGKEIEILNDGHVYNPRKDEWQKLAGKFPVMAGSALSIDREHILLLGGTDTIISGSDAHPGFGNNILFYNTRAEEIIPSTAKYPLAVTTSVAHKKNIFYMGSGEIKPGVRTPIILKGKYRIK
ncbi:MAG: sodium:solute symporter, partial [Rikenellaceae bacterium]